MKLITNSKELEFAIFCIENVAIKLELEANTYDVVSVYWRWAYEGENDIADTILGVRANIEDIKVMIDVALTAWYK